MKKNAAIEKFIKTSREWMEELKKFDDQSIALKPSENQWGIAELYDHIMKVARTYQIYNFHKCLREGVKKGYSKNYIGFVIFDLKYLPNRKMRMESFPTKLVNDFTPILKSKNELIEEFAQFIEEVSSLEKYIVASDSSKKHRHPLFGWINATEWFRLIEIHMAHHLPQRKRISAFVSSQIKGNS